MARKHFNITKQALFAWLLLGGFIVLLIPDRITGKFQLAFAHIFRWPLNISRNLVLSAVTIQPVNNNEGEREIQLKNYIANLQARIAELEKRNEQLAGFRSKNPLEGAKFILANIAQATAEELIIDRGKDDGLSTGQFVLGQNSVIGIIAEVSAATAKVRLITSPLCKLEVKIADKPAVTQGDKKNVKIKTLLQKYKISTGEKVFCQPKSGLLNTPIIVGTVAECKTGESPHLWDITIKPACNISTLSSVDVIKY
jgi:rod shape-determining protein MreC